MPKQRQPVGMVIAKGRKHFTKQDIEERLAQEIDVPFKNIEAPAYLTGTLVEEFYDIAYKLLDIGVMTELDEDSLARYLISKQHYLKYSNLVTKALQRGDVEETAKLITAQDKLYKQVRIGAADLGLTITSRCKLVIPNAPQKYVEL
jgi:P27 family predicted phage terminase small subunit